MKIDIFAHIMPPKYKKILEGWPKKPHLLDMIESVPTLFNLDERFRIMDRYPDVVQILTLVGHSPEEIAGPREAAEMAMRINDELAELVFKYPDRFPGATAVLPMNDIDAALKEVDRALNQLKMRGVLIRIPINGKPVDLPEFMPLYQKMSEYNLPIWFHPQRSAENPGGSVDIESKYAIRHIWGLPYETTIAMTCLVFGGVLERYPNLKIITHHCGAMVPFFVGRIVSAYDYYDTRVNMRFTQRLTKPFIEYFRMFYNDTATFGSRAALMCAYDFFGADHMIFGTDMPMDSQIGDRLIRETVRAIETMDITDREKKKIFEDNARNLLRLPA